MKLNSGPSQIALVAVIFATPALAQEPAPAPEQSGEAGIGEIIVTAQRRSESVQKSSVSIEVLSADIAANLTKPSDLTAIAPGVQVANYGPQPQVYIRGIGDQTANSVGQSGVAFNVDGVYYSRPTSVGPAMFDVERIEILKGPQGTLYGRNASGGAVNVITTSPKLGQISGYASGEVGNFDSVRANLAVNLPLGTNAALRVAAQLVSRDGYLSAGANDDRSKSVRAKLLWEPSNAVSILASADWSKITGVGGGFVLRPSPDGNPWRDQLQKPLAYPFAFTPATAPFVDANDRSIRSENVGASIEANVDVGFATLTVIPAYRHQDHQAVYYAQNFRYAESPTTDQYSVEARLGGATGPFKWVAGLYYFREEQDQLFTGALFRLSSASLQQQRGSYAAFAETTFSVTDNVRLIAGGRYTKERVTGGFVYGTAAVPVIPFTPTGTPVVIDPIKSSEFNYRFGGEIDLSPTSMLFATYATGFKAGGFQPSPRCGAARYDPETLSAITVGSRNRFADNRLQVNGEFFHWKYKSQQVAVVKFDPCGDVGQFTSNPGDATITGANLDVVFKAGSNTTLRGSIEYTHSVYDRFLINQLGAGVYAPGLGSRCSATARAAGLFDIDCSGQPLNRTPEWAGTAGIAQTFPLSGDKEVVFDLNSQFASSRWIDYSYGPNSKDSAYITFNSQLTLKATGRWSISAFVNNITNRAVYTGGYAHTALAANGTPYVVAMIQPPRMYGVRARFDFGS